MTKTKIEWSDRVWNPVTGCTKVSPGCKNCYAETLAKRFWQDREFTDVQTHFTKLQLPLGWRKPSRIFVNSMSDLFHEEVDDEFILHVYRIIAMAQKHKFLVLTKRPERALTWYDFYREHLLKSVKMEYYKLPNLWMGVTVENQRTFDRIYYLRHIPAVVRFVSFEPLLERVRGSLESIHWVIVGGESGFKARPFELEWAREIRDVCKVNKIPFFFKQTGQFWMNQNHGLQNKGNSFEFIPEDLRIREYPDG